MMPEPTTAASKAGADRFMAIRRGNVMGSRVMSAPGSAAPAGFAARMKALCEPALHLWRTASIDALPG